MLTYILILIGLFQFSQSQSLKDLLQNQSISVYMCGGAQLTHTHPYPVSPHCVPPPTPNGYTTTTVHLYKKNPEALRHSGCLCSSSTTTRTCHGSTWSIFGEYTKWSKTELSDPVESICHDLCLTARQTGKQATSGIIGDYSCRIFSETRKTYVVHVVTPVTVHSDAPGGPVTVPGVAHHCSAGSKVCRMRNHKLLVDVEPVGSHGCQYIRTATETCHAITSDNHAFLSCTGSGRGYTIELGVAAIIRCDVEMYLSNEGYLIHVGLWNTRPTSHIRLISDREIWNRMTNTFGNARLSYLSTSVTRWSHYEHIQFVYNSCIERYTRYATARALAGTHPSEAVRLLLEREDIIGRISGKTIEYGVCPIGKLSGVKYDTTKKNGKCGTRLRANIAQIGEKYLDTLDMTTWDDQVYEPCVKDTVTTVYHEKKYYSVSWPNNSGIQYEEDTTNTVVPPLKLDYNYTTLYTDEELNSMSGIRDDLRTSSIATEDTLDTLDVGMFGVITYKKNNSGDTVYHPPHITFHWPITITMVGLLSYVVVVSVTIIIICIIKCIRKRTGNRTKKEIVFKDNYTENIKASANRANEFYPKKRSFLIS